MGNTVVKCMAHAWLLQGADKALAGGDQISSKKGADSDAEGGAVPVRAIANGTSTPGTTDRDTSGVPWLLKPTVSLLLFPTL